MKCRYDHSDNKIEAAWVKLGCRPIRGAAVWFQTLQSCALEPDAPPPECERDVSKVVRSQSVSYCVHHSQTQWLYKLRWTDVELLLQENAKDCGGAAAISLSLAVFASSMLVSSLLHSRTWDEPPEAETRDKQVAKGCFHSLWEPTGRLRRVRPAE